MLDQDALLVLHVLCRLGRSSTMSDRNAGTGNPATRRGYTPFTDEELERIDEWGFGQKIRERAQLLRAFAFKGLEADRDHRRSAQPESVR